MKLTIAFIILTFIQILLPMRYSKTKITLVIILSMICGYKLALL